MEDEAEEAIWMDLVSGHARFVSRTTHLVLGPLRKSRFLPRSMQSEYGCLVVLCVLTVLLIFAFDLMLSPQSNFQRLYRKVAALAHRFWNYINSSDFALDGRGDPILAESSYMKENVSVYSIQGRRNKMEDRFSVKEDIGRTGISMYAVFDGHGGDYAVNYVLRNLVEMLCQRIEDRIGVIKTPTEEATVSVVRRLSMLLKDEVLAVDERLIRQLKRIESMSGTTALIALLYRGYLVVANTGDTRGIMCCGTDGSVVPLSFDHKPQQLKERTRIEKAGGQVIFLGVWRVMGVLATSRALGDYPLKKNAKLVIPDPDVLIFDLRDFKPTFLCLASDGLWDAFTNDDAKNFIQDHITDDDFGVRAITREALSRGSTDNITVMIIKIPSLPPTSPDAKKIRFLNGVHSESAAALKKRDAEAAKFHTMYGFDPAQEALDLLSNGRVSQDGADPKEKVGQAETGPKESVGQAAADPKERVGHVEADSKEKVGQADSKEKVVDAEADREEKVGQGGDGGSKEGGSPAADPKEGKSVDPKEGARHEEIRKLEELPSESASENEAAL